METVDSFGEWLRRRREKLGLTRAELAGRAGCSVSALRKIEADERRPSRQLAELLGRCLHLTPEEQPAFLDAARGHRLVQRLGAPSAVAAEAPPGALAEAGPECKLPTPATPLIGREAELAALAQLLGDPGCRLLTLVGPGGIGKTRLALEAACRRRDSFADGIFFVSLAAIDSPELVLPTIAHAVGFNFSGPADPRRQLIGYLRHKQTLLLLDNLEHLLGDVAWLVQLLEEAPALKLLTTSRARLEVKGEWAFEVQGLPMPADSCMEAPESYSAGELFVQRARQAQVAFQMTAAVRSSVIRICHLVEGMPLAIELAAAWVPVLSCREIADEIEHGLDILSTTLRDAPERQRSMQAVFDHSWQLLSAEEQRVLRRLAVFCGGFQRQAAEVVAGATLPLLSALVARSFLRCTSTGRFTMHELVNQYLAVRLAEEPEEEDAARERHSACFTAFAAGLEAGLRGERQLEALAEMDAEIDNIRRAWRRAVKQENLAAIQRPLRALWSFYDIRGWFGEAESGLGWAADRLEQSQRSDRNSEAAVAVLAAYVRAQQGWFCLRIGRFEEARRLLESNLELLRAAGAEVELVDALQHAGALDLLTGDFARSRARFQEMFHLALKCGDIWNAAIAGANTGLAAYALGDYEEAQKRLEATVVSFRAQGDGRMLGAALHFLGAVHCSLGCYGQARAYLQESLDISRTVGDRWIEAMALRELGNVARETGATAEAASLFHDSLLLAREIGEHWCTMQALSGYGAAKLAVGDVAAARAAFHEELGMAWETQALPDVLAALAGLVRCSLLQEAGEETQRAALASLAFILGHPAATQKTKDDAGKLRSELLLLLDIEGVEGAEADAKKLSLEALVAGLLAPG